MSDIDWSAAAKYIAGEATPAERGDFEAWMRSHPDEAREIAALAPHFRARGSAARVDVDAAWTRVARRMDEQPFAVAAGRADRFGTRATRLVIAGAVAAAALIGAVLAPSLIARRAPLQTVATGIGERRDVVLRDGTRVTLGPGTTMRARVGARGERTIDLTGEALFVVTHDASRRFVVRAGDALIEDLGTAFTVRSRPDRTVLDVAVLEGSVAVETGDVARRVLRAGDAASFARGSAEVARIDVSDATAWSRGELAFRATPLREVAAELERWFRVRVRVAPAVAERPLTATFAGETIDQVARALAGSLDVSVVRAGDTLSISAR